ncbi:hypothetical protein Lser_V15G26652 [Lactuca serriola]
MVGEEKRHLMMQKKFEKGVVSVDVSGQTQVLRSTASSTTFDGDVEELL